MISALVAASDLIGHVRRAQQAAPAYPLAGEADGKTATGAARLSGVNPLATPRVLVAAQELGDQGKRLQPGQLTPDELPPWPQPIPSPQDRRVAAQAQAEIARAQAELQKKKTKEQGDEGNSSFLSSTKAGNASPALFDRARKAYERAPSGSGADDQASILFGTALRPLIA